MPHTQSRSKTTGARAQEGRRGWRGRETREMLEAAETDLTGDGTLTRKERGS